MDAAQAEILKSDLMGKCVGGWTIVDYLGSGKSAVVMDGVKGQEGAAIKVFHPELVERYGRQVQLERILREASLEGAAHPNLVKILGGGECSETGYLFVVMERLDYPNLHDARETVPEGAIPRIIMQVASAARFLEDRGLAHRDIKPENIVISQDFGRAVLLDLGVLRPIGNSDLTDVDQRLFIGTLRYSSPEYLMRHEQDTVDGWRAITFYQLGAVLHDLLMRRPLFSEYSEPFSLLVDAVARVVPEVHGQNTDCVKLAKHCLIKSPATRLKLVSWDKFQGLVSNDGGVAKMARERVLERQAYFQSNMVEEGLAKRGGAQKPSRRALDDICNRLESRIAILINALQVFPLRITQSSKDEREAVCSTLVVFDSDDAKGLPFRISVFIRMNFLDQNGESPIYDVDACCAISLHEPAVDELDVLSHVYSGEIVDFLDGSLLEELFMCCLEEAYKFVEKGGTLSVGCVHLVAGGVTND